MAANHRRSACLERFPQTFSIQRKVTPDTEKRRLHLHEQLELIVAVSDNMGCQYETGSLPIPAGSVLLLDALTPHYIYKSSPGGMVDRYVLYFSSEYVSSLSVPELNLLRCFYRNHTPVPGLVSPPEGERLAIRRLLDEMLLSTAQAADHSPGSLEALTYGMQTRFLLGQLLALLNRMCPCGGVQASSSPETVNTALFIKGYIQEHYSQPLRADDLARKFYISKTQLYKTFHQVLGTSVGSYITQVRIIKAKDLLINSPYPVELIAGKVGYQNLSAFSRAFKAHVGVTPNAFRRRGDGP